MYPRSLLLVLGNLFDLGVYDGGDVGLAAHHVREGEEVDVADAVVVREPIDDRVLSYMVDEVIVSDHGDEVRSWSGLVAHCEVAAVHVPRCQGSGLER